MTGSISPDQLRSIARQATSEFLTQGTDLTSSVVKAASLSGLELTSEHVRRVCEMTYHDTYERMWKTASGPDRYVTFDPPDAAAAANQLRAEKVASVAVARRTQMVAQPSQISKTASAPSAGFDFRAARMRAFDAAVAPKVASAPTRWENPVSEVLKVRGQLKEAMTELRNMHASADGAAKLAMMEFLAHAEQCCKDGVTMGEVLHACVSAGSEKVAESVLNPLVHEVATVLSQRGYAVHTKMGSMREVNPQHPMPRAFMKVASLRQEAAQADLALESVKREFTYLNEQVRDVLA